MCIVTSLLLVFICMLAYFYKRRQQQFNVFKSLGIPGPEPHWLLGNFRELNNSLRLEIFQRWSKQYGKVFGFYDGPTPVLMTSDLELLQQVFIKQFSRFHGRKLYPVQPDPDFDDVNLFMARGARWKRLRAIIKPTFSSAKLKQTMPLIDRKVSILLSHLHACAADNKPVDIARKFESLTLDVICGAAFGIDVDSQSNPSEPFLLACRKTFDDFAQKPFILQLCVVIPELGWTIWFICKNIVSFFVFVLPGDRMLKGIDSILQLRRKEKVHRVDLLQLMMDAEADEKSINNTGLWPYDDQDGEAKRQSTQPDSSEVVEHSPGISDRRKLTFEEIKEQCLLFTIAGFETIRMTLTYTCYLLAIYPEKQDKLIAEIDSCLSADEEPTYEKVHSIPYLDMVICETLRLYPIAGEVTDRMCMESCTVNGIYMPKGVIVQPDVFTIHYDPELWGPTDPNLFEPERFSAELKAARHPMAWLPFGAGPRNCVGMRFGMMEVKLALAQMMQHFRIERCDATEVPLVLEEAGVIRPKNGVVVRMVSRR